jgi:hypothetical protein
MVECISWPRSVFAGAITSFKGTVEALAGNLGSSNSGADGSRRRAVPEFRSTQAGQLRMINQPVVVPATGPVPKIAASPAATPRVVSHTCSR